MPGELVVKRDDSRLKLGRLLTLLQEQVRASTDVIGRRALQRSLDALMFELNLDAEPRVRACPVCGAVGMCDAALCSVCWSRLAPLGLAAAP